MITIEKENLSIRFGKKDLEELDREIKLLFDYYNNEASNDFEKDFPYLYYLWTKYFN